MLSFYTLKMETRISSVTFIFIHLAVCLTTGPKTLPKPALHIVRSRASSFKWEYPLLSLRLSDSFLRLLPCLLVTSPPCIFASITRCRRQFLHKMWQMWRLYTGTKIGYTSTHAKSLYLQWLLTCVSHISRGAPLLAYYGPVGLTLRRLMSYIYGAPILDVSRSHTTTQHSR